MRHAATEVEGPSGLALLVRADPVRPFLHGQAARARRANAATVGVGLAIAAEGPADVESPAAAVAAGRLTMGRLRAVLRQATDRVPVRPIAASPVPSSRTPPLLEVGNGVLGVATPEAIDVGRVGATSK